jgi:hypothetical protein
LGRAIIELIRKGKVALSCGIRGAGTGVLRKQTDIDFRVEWLVVLDILDAGPLWRADEGKRRTRQPEAGGAVRRKFSSHESSGFYARHVFDEAMLGRSAAGSSEETGNGRRDGEPLSPL